MTMIKATKLIAGGLVAVLLIWWSISAYGAARYRAGERAANEAWERASARVVASALASSEKATAAEVPRLIAHQRKVEQEKERIDAAIANGSSPIDALFRVERVHTD